MAIVKKRNYDNPLMGDPNNLFGFFTSMGIPAQLVKETDTRYYVYLTLDENIQVQIKISLGGYNDFAVYLDINGNVLTSSDTYRYCEAICVYGESIFYLLFTNGYDTRGACVFLEKIDGKWYYGYTAPNAFITGMYSIYNFNLACTDGSSGHSHRVILNFSSPLNTINYTTDSIFAGGYKEETDPNTLSCTTVTAGNVITLEGENYFSVSSNTLILLDE